MERKEETSVKAHLMDTSQFHTRLYEYHQDGRFSDVTIVVEGKEYKCHKVILAAHSEYFSTMFTSSYAESQQDKIPLKDVSQEGFEEILKMCYNRESNITKDNVCEIFQIAQYLAFEKVQEACMEIMCKYDDLKYFYLVIQKEEQKFINLMLSNVAHNFSSLWKTSEFDECPQLELEKLLSHRHLMVDSEFEVFQALEKWFDSNSVATKEKLKLLKCVRFHLFSPEEWKLLLKSDVFEDSECSKYLTSLITYAMDIYGRPLEVEQKQNEPRGCYSFILVRKHRCIETKTLHVESQYAVDIMPVKQPQFAQYSSQACTGVTVNNFLYILDGSTRKCFRYCPVENTWIDLDNMRQRRKCFSATATKTCIYVFGGLSMGCHDGQTMRDVDQYDLKSNKWTKIDTLGDNMPSSIKAVAVGDEIYVFYNTSIGIFNKYTGQCDKISDVESCSESAVAVASGNLIYLVGTDDFVERFDSAKGIVTCVYLWENTDPETRQYWHCVDGDEPIQANTQGFYWEDIHSGQKQICVIENEQNCKRTLNKYVLNDDTQSFTTINMETANDILAGGLVILKSKCSLFSNKDV